MKQLSESLEELAARDKTLEHASTVALGGDPEALEARRREAEKAFLSDDGRDPAAAVAVAAHCVNVAKYALVDAALARAEANELTGQT